MGAWTWLLGVGLAVAESDSFVADTWDTDFSGDSAVVADTEVTETDTETDTDAGESDDTDAPTDSADSDDSDAVDTYPSGGLTATGLAGEAGGCGCASTSRGGALASLGVLLGLALPRRRR